MWKGECLDLEEQVTKGHSYYEHVMKELTEMKGKVSNELNEVKRNVNAGNNPDFESYREVLQREVKQIQKQSYQNRQVIEKDLIKKKQQLKYKIELIGRIIW